MDRLGDVRGLNVFGAGEVGDGAAYFKHVGVNRSFVKALELDGARAVHSLANGSGGFAGVFAGELLIAQGRHFDLNVNAVEQRT